MHLDTAVVLKASITADTSDGVRTRSTQHCMSTRNEGTSDVQAHVAAICAGDLRCFLGCRKWTCSCRHHRDHSWHYVTCRLVATPWLQQLKPCSCQLLIGVKLCQARLDYVSFRRFLSYRISVQSSLVTYTSVTSYIVHATSSGSLQISYKHEQ